MNSGRCCTQFVAILTAFLFFLPIGVSAQDNQQSVRSADIDAILQQDGTLKITETLQYNLGEMPQTGFVRRLTAPANGSIEINSVYRDGLEDDYRITQAGKTKRVIIGTEGVEITGEHNYQISYTMSHTVVSGNGTAQLVWPVVDNAGVVAEDITINLSSPLDISRVSCRIEQYQKGCPVTRIDTGYRATLDELPSGKQLTIQANMPADQITTELPEDDSGKNWIYWLIFGVIFAIGSIIYSIFNTGRTGSDGDGDGPVPERINSLS